MTELKNRYVGAVLRALPEDQRSEVDRELRTAIDDAIDNRVEMGEATEQAEVAVLNDLGDPDRLASEYSGKPLALIGPRYYLAWIRLTKRLLVTIPPLVGVGNAVVRLALDSNGLDAVWGAVWAGWVAAIIAAINVLFWSTLGFVIAERVEYWGGDEVIPMGKWTVDNLPAVPDRQVGIVETVFEVTIQLLVIGVLVALLVNPNIPILNPVLWDLAIPLALGLMVISLVFTVLRFRIGRWTRGVAVFNGLLNIGFAVLWFWVLVHVGVLSSEFVTENGWDEWLDVTVIVTAVVIVLVCLWDAVEGFSKARKAKLG